MTTKTYLTVFQGEYEYVARKNSDGEIVPRIFTNRAQVEEWETEGFDVFVGAKRPRYSIPLYARKPRQQ